MTEASAPGPFLICDLRPEWNRRPYVTFWRPNNANYAYPLVWSGDYTEAEVMAGGSYYTTVEGGKLIRKIGPPFAGYTCCNGDREAFEAYASATKRRAA